MALPDAASPAVVVVLQFWATKTTKCVGNSPPNCAAMARMGKGMTALAVLSTVIDARNVQAASRSSVSVKAIAPSVPIVPDADAGQVGVSFSGAIR